MAMKMKLMKLKQEIHGYAQVTNRRPAPRPAVLYLMALRERTARAITPRRRLSVAADPQAGASTPLPIKINHVKSSPPDFPVVIY